MGSLVLLDLMGGVALLLWGLHMVHSGVLRAFGPDLRRGLAKGLRNRFTAFAAGVGLTALLQSSTATALITSSFAAEGLVGLVPALAIMLGANLGTTLIVQILSFNIAAAAPVLFIFGLVAFRSGAQSRIKDVGRVLIGLGLMLLALHILLDTLAPAENVPGVRLFMNAITGDPALCIIIGALVTWLVHSSVASVLLVMSLAYSQFISPSAALALVLGANLGSAINPLFEGARRDNPASYRLPVGNLINRLAGVLVVAPFLRPITEVCRRGSLTWRSSRPHSTLPSTWQWLLSSSACSTVWRRCSKKLFRIALRRPIRRARAISTRARLQLLPSHWQTPLAKPCTWATTSKSCCAR